MRTEILGETARRRLHMSPSPYRKIAARLSRRLPATDRAQDDPRLLRFYNGFRIQSGRLATDTRRAGDRKWGRRSARPLSTEHHTVHCGNGAYRAECAGPKWSRGRDRISPK